MPAYSITRAQIFDAFFGKLKTLSPTPFVTVTRRMVMPTQIVGASNICPMLILWEQDQHTRYSGNMQLPVTEYMAELIIYFQNNNIQTNDVGKNVLFPSGSLQLNPLLDAVYGVFEIDNQATGRFTLGGIVNWCRIEGRTIIQTGDVDSEGVGGAQIPISIMVSQ